MIPMPNDRPRVKVNRRKLGLAIKRRSPTAYRKDAPSQQRFITSIVTQKASESDDPGLDQTFYDQALSGLERPTEFYVDGAYVSAARLHQAKQEDWELVGPAQPSAHRSGLAVDYRIEVFDISISERSARCPSGYASTQCSRLAQAKDQKVTFSL